MSTYQNDQQKAYRLHNPKRRAHVPLSDRKQEMFARMARSPAFQREPQHALTNPVLTRWHTVMDRNAV